MVRSRLIHSNASSRAPRRSHSNLEYLNNDCHRIYSCVHCRAHLANHDELISTAFQGTHGRAYLFNAVVNVGCGPAEQRLLMTGLHDVADIYCDSCKTTLGWKYKQAFEASQKYKEGKYIIELAHMLKENSWDLTSYNTKDMLKDVMSQQQLSKERRRRPNYNPWPAKKEDISDEKSVLLGTTTATTTTSTTTTTVNKNLNYNRNEPTANGNYFAPKPAPASSVRASTFSSSLISSASSTNSETNNHNGHHHHAHKTVNNKSQQAAIDGSTLPSTGVLLNISHQDKLDQDNGMAAFCTRSLYVGTTGHKQEHGTKLTLDNNNDDAVADADDDDDLPPLVQTLTTSTDSNANNTTTTTISTSTSTSTGTTKTAAIDVRQPKSKDADGKTTRNLAELHLTPSTPCSSEAASPFSSPSPSLSPSSSPSSDSSNLSSSSASTPTSASQSASSSSSLIQSQSFITSASASFQFGLSQFRDQIKNQSKQAT